MSSKYSGSCLCGEVHFDVYGEFDHFFLCHCRHCRKDTGSAHAANLFATRAKLTWQSGQSKVKTYELAGTRHVRSFCLNCGSALPTMQQEGLLAVPAGALDSPIAMTPDAHLFVASRADWDQDLEQVPMMDGLPS